MSTTAPTAPALPERVTPPFASMFVKHEEIGRPKSIILYGQHGARKTTIAAGIVNVPGINRILYVDIDNGSEVFLTEPSVFEAYQQGRIDLVQIDKTDPNAFVQLRYFFGGNTTKDANDNIIELPAEALKPEYGYDAIILDTLDVAQEVGVDWFLANTWNEQGKPDTRGAWGKVKKWTLDLAWSFQNTRHTIGVILMHEKKEASNTGAVYIRPELAGSAQEKIGGVPSMMIRLEKREDEAGETHIVALTGDDTAVDAKNRYRLPKEIADLTMPGLFALIDGQKSETIRKIAEKQAQAPKPAPAPTEAPAAPAVAAA